MTAPATGLGFGVKRVVEGDFRTAARPGRRWRGSSLAARPAGSARSAPGSRNGRNSSDRPAPRSLRRAVPAVRPIAGGSAGCRSPVLTGRQHRHRCQPVPTGGAVAEYDRRDGRVPDRCAIVLRDQRQGEAPAARSVLTINCSVWLLCSACRNAAAVRVAMAPTSAGVSWRKVMSMVVS